MIKILFVCHRSAEGRQEFAVLVGQNGQITAFEIAGYYGFTTSEGTKLNRTLFRL